MPIWGVVNQKGGVGKTTTSVNLAAGLAGRGQRVLLIDADPQGNATTGFGLDKSKLEKTLYDVLAEAVDNPDAPDTVAKAVVQMDERLSVLPATLDLAGAEPLLLNAVGKEMVLRDALEPAKERYDWIVIDAPPSLGLLTVNILAASDRVIVPMQCEYYALEGLSHLMKTLDIVKRRINPRLEIGTVLLTMYDPRNRLTLNVEEEIRDYFGSKVSQVAIPRNVRLSEAPSFGEPAVKQFPDSKGAIAYQQLVEEIMERCVAH